MEFEKDFVCGVNIEREKSAGSYDYQGKTYHFCSQERRDEFSRSPENYIK